jgi:hypothetical protein
LPKNIRCPSFRSFGTEKVPDTFYSPGDSEDIAELQPRGQAFAMPAGDGLVPPHGPFPSGQAIGRQKVHHRPKAFHMIEGFRHIEASNNQKLTVPIYS